MRNGDHVAEDVASDDRVAANGALWHERLAAAAFASTVPRQAVRRSPPSAAAETDCEDDINSWRTAVDPDGAGLFEKRLQWGGLDPGRLSEWLPVGGTSAAAAAGQPPWLPELQQLRRDVRQQALAGATEAWDPSEPGAAFADLLQPMVSWNWRRLVEHEPTAKRVTPATGRALRTALLRRLSEVCGRALGAEFDRTRTPGATIALKLLPEATEAMHPNGRYQQWCRDHLSDGLGDLLDQYPVLGRLIVLVGTQWRLNTAEMLTRIEHDRGLLSSRFGIPLTAQLSNIESGLSDPHRGGRSVAVLVFGDGDGASSTSQRTCGSRSNSRR